MKIAGMLLAACVVLSIIRSVVVAVIAGLAIVLLWGVFFRPREMFGLLVFGLMMQLFEHHAGACIAAATFLLALAAAADRRTPP